MPNVLGMGNLVVTRSRGQRIVIGDSTIISIRDIGAYCVDLEITVGGRALPSKVMQVNEVVPLNHDISLSLVSANGSKCRIRITAPTDIPVHRESVALQIAAEAAASAPIARRSDLAEEIGEFDGFPVGQMYDPDAVVR